VQAFRAAAKSLRFRKDVYLVGRNGERGGNTTKMNVYNYDCLRRPAGHERHPASACAMENRPRRNIIGDSLGCAWGC